jgi:hypothetical protein
MTWAVTDQLTSTSISGATVVLTVNAAIAAGSLVVVGVNEDSTGATGTLADSQGNTYTAITTNSSISGNRVTVFYSVLGTALSTSDTWTFTKGNSGGKAGISALSATGNLASPLDTAVTATNQNASATSVTVTSGTPAVSGELFVGFSGDSKGKTWTQDTGHGWASPPDTFTTGISSKDTTGIGGYQANAGTGTIVYAPTLAALGTITTIIVGFKPSLANPLSKGYVFF